MKYFIYQLRDARKNEPFYVGKGSNDRPYDHLKEARCWDGKGSGKKNFHKLNTIRSIVSSGGQVSIDYIYTDLTNPQAFILESKVISFWGRRDDGTGILTNLSDGGEGVVGRSEAGSESIRRSNSSRVWTEEAKRKISLANSGKVPNAEARVKMSKAQIARGPMPQEVKDAISRSNTGRKLSLEACQKMSQSKKGQGAKRFYITHPNGITTLEANISKFATEHGLTATHLTRMLKGRRKSHGGYTGRYEEEV